MSFEPLHGLDHLIPFTNIEIGPQHFLNNLGVLRATNSPVISTALSFSDFAYTHYRTKPFKNFRIFLRNSNLNVSSTSGTLFYAGATTALTIEKSSSPSPVGFRHRSLQLALTHQIGRASCRESV